MVFGVGIFAAITSIIRLHTIYIFTTSDDPFQAGIQVSHLPLSLAYPIFHKRPSKIPSVSREWCEEIKPTKLPLR
jgi:hypothetical protein